MRQIIVVSVACVCIRINPIIHKWTHARTHIRKITKSLRGRRNGSKIHWTADKNFVLDSFFGFLSSSFILFRASHQSSTVLVCTRRWTGILWIFDWDIYLARNAPKIPWESQSSCRPCFTCDHAIIGGWGGAIKLALHFTLFYIRVQKNLIENNTPAVRWTLCSL